MLMGIDFSKLADGAGLVKQHHIDSESERTTMRDADDLAKLGQLIIGDEIGCDHQKLKNVFTNMASFRYQRRRYY